MPAVTWLPWNVDAFARARAERKPVLLSIVTQWSEACREMDETSYADPAVVALVTDRFVPIRVDADRRPDISERYSLGGWPTTAFLTAGGEIAGGGTFVAADRMADVLLRAAAAFAGRAAELADRPPPVSDAVTPVPGPALTEAALQEIAFATFDAEHGGFGGAPKFPLTAPVTLALHLQQDSGDAQAGRIAQLTLDRMGWSGLHDEGDGGFFRCTETRAWTGPHREKLLEVNAALVRLYVDAGERLQSERYAERALDTLRYAQNWLADPVDGGWAASQYADSAYYATQDREFDGRRSRPPVDRTLLAGPCGAMVSAALLAARAFDDEGLGAFAVTSLERLLAICYRPGQGVARYVQDGTRAGGLLEDQLAVAEACLDAFDSTANIVYEMMAEELARHATRWMWDPSVGLFADRADPPPSEAIGRMSRRLLPFVSNCRAAGLLHRLADASGDHDFAATADAVLAALAPLAAAQGPDAAHYLLARRAARLR